MSADTSIAIYAEFGKIRHQAVGIMKSKVKRVYVETSVVSGMFDANDHPVKAQPFWNAVFKGKIRIILSDVLDDEVGRAPEIVQNFYRSLPESLIEWIVSTHVSNTLAERYIRAGILTATHLTDCKHVALAMLAGADVLVSWNSKHIVNPHRIRRFNDVSIGFGCDEIKFLIPNNLTQRGQ